MVAESAARSQVGFPSVLQNLGQVPTGEPSNEMCEAAPALQQLLGWRGELGAAV